MKYLEEFRDSAAARALSRRLAQTADGLPTVKLMEVCGTHTMSIARFGLKSLFPENVILTSGPGCPVCVSPQRYMDAAVAYCRRPETIVATFGDMVRVPGSTSSLEKEQADGADVRVVLSTMDALRIAGDNPGREVVFLGIGFETTAPTIAAAVLESARHRIDNFSVLCGHKIMPPALAALVTDPEIRIDGYICPPHVSAIIGGDAYRFIAEEHLTPCVIAGFEPLDILQGVLWLVEMIASGKPDVLTQYSRVVTPEGNREAQRVLAEVFVPADDEWRGIGTIPGSGLAIRPEFARYDAERRLPVEAEPTRVPRGCICGRVLKGISTPPECKLFAVECTPNDPVGACMVSSEGACAAAFKYERNSI
jgi:hydrogenase expression/formation protein HypD